MQLKKPALFPVLTGNRVLGEGKRVLGEGLTFLQTIAILTLTLSKTETDMPIKAKKVKDDDDFKNPIRPLWVSNLMFGVLFSVYMVAFLYISFSTGML